MNGIDAVRDGPCGVASATGFPFPVDFAAGTNMNPVSILMSVDFPAPFSPTIAWTSPPQTPNRPL